LPHSLQKHSKSKQENFVESHSEHEETIHDEDEETIADQDEAVITEDELDMVQPQEQAEIDEGEESPALVINVQSWATPIVGLVMLVMGLLGGYLLYPQVSARLMDGTPVAKAPGGGAPPEATAAGSEPAAAANPQTSEADRQEMMAFLIDQTRHFKGNPEAPVTIIEFSDFQ
jgi:xanthosine utilization system XapX-like protein